MKAVFLDKDGTLIEDVPYNVDPALIRFTPGAETALRQLTGAGYRLVIISNQSGVARGYFPESALLTVEQKLCQMLREIGVRLDGFYYCPHFPVGSVAAYVKECDCRKPAPGLILQAAHELNINLAQSWMVGDILNDVEAGKRAGCKTVLLDNGHETEWVLNELRQPDYTAPTLSEAATAILGQTTLTLRSPKVKNYAG